MVYESSLKEAFRICLHDVGTSREVYAYSVRFGCLSKVLNDIFPEEVLLIVLRISSQFFLEIHSGVKISLNKLGNGIY